MGLKMPIYWQNEAVHPRGTCLPPNHVFSHLKLFLNELVWWWSQMAPIRSSFKEGPVVSAGGNAGLGQP